MVRDRYEHGSIILTSNTSFSEWGALLGNEVLATALLDHLLHHAEAYLDPGQELADEGSYGRWQESSCFQARDASLGEK